MSVIEKLVKERRTVHAFEGQELSEDLVRTALELALWAPNHKMTKPWRFVRVMGRARKDLAEIAVRLRSRKPDFTDIQKQALIKKFTTQGSLVFFAQAISRNAEEDLENYATLACAVQNYSLFFWDKGYGTKWSTGAILKDPQTYQLLQLDESQFKIVGMIWAGKAVTVPAAQERGELDDYFTTIGSQL